MIIDRFRLNGKGSHATTEVALKFLKFIYRLKKTRLQIILKMI